MIILVKPKEKDKRGSKKVEVTSCKKKLLLSKLKGVVIFSFTNTLIILL